MENLRYKKIGSETCIRSLQKFSVDPDEAYVDSGTSETKESEKLEFSTTIADLNSRMRLMKQPLRVRVARTMTVYRQFFKSKNSTLKAEELSYLKYLFRSDLMTLFNAITDEVIKGQKINILFGTSSLTPEINKAADELSIPYRKLITATKELGWESKTIRDKANLSFEKFIRVIEEWIFPENLTNQLATQNPLNRERVTSSLTDVIYEFNSTKETELAALKDLDLELTKLYKLKAIANIKSIIIDYEFDEGSKVLLVKLNPVDIIDPSKLPSSFKLSKEKFSFSDRDDDELNLIELAKTLRSNSSFNKLIRVIGIQHSGVPTIGLNSYVTLDKLFEVYDKKIFKGVKIFTHGQAPDMIRFKDVFGDPEFPTDSLDKSLTLTIHELLEKINPEKLRVIDSPIQDINQGLIHLQVKEGEEWKDYELELKHPVAKKFKFSFSTSKVRN